MSISAEPTLPPVPNSEPKDLKSVLVQIKDQGVTAFAAITGLVYTFGFLAINANLSKSGISDFDFLSARYLLGGFTFVFFMACFYFCAGRKIVLGEEWYKAEAAHYEKLGLRRKWSVPVLANSFIDVIFQCCVSAFLFAGIAFGGSEVKYFFAALMFGFIFSNLTGSWELPSKWPRTNIALSILFRTIAITAFYFDSASGLLKFTFLIMFALVLFINLTIHSVTTYGTSVEKNIFLTAYSLFVLAGTALSFGALLYGDISNKIGGARPQTVSIALTKDAIELFPENLKSGTPPMISGALIHQNTEYLYVTIEKRTIRIRNEDVTALIASPPLANNALTESASIKLGPLKTMGEPVNFDKWAETLKNLMK